MAQATRIINKFGNMQGWNAVTLNLLGRDVEGITEIEYDDTVSKENAYGGGGFPVGRGEGNYEARASITLYKEESDALQQSLPPGGRIQNIAAFDIPVVYELPSGKVQTDIIRTAEFTNKGVAVKQGDKTIGYKYDLVISHIDWNV